MQNNALRALFIAVFFLTTAAITAPARYVGDGETADFALELSSGTATIYLARKPTNQPLQKAKVSLQLVDASSSIYFEETSLPGVYKLKIEAPSLEKSQVIIEDGEETDIIDVGLADGGVVAAAVTAAAAPQNERPISLWTLIFVLGLVSGVGLSIIASRFLLKRKTSPNVTLGLAFLALTASLAMQADHAFAHEGHEHEGPSIDDQTGTSAAIVLHKRAQFLIGLTTVKAELTDIPDSFISYGHIIAKPQQDAFILAPQAGYVRGSQNLVLGQKVAKGQTLAAIESVGRIGLTAPFDGQVLEILIAEGSRVEAGTKLFRVTDPSTVWVDAELYESDIAKFNKATSAAIGVEGNAEPYPAKVLNFMTPISEDTRTAKGFLELDNPSDKLRLGSFVSIHFSLPSQSKGISLPSAAVVTRSGEQLVYVQTGPESFESRNVVTQKGPEPGTIVIVSGVKDGDRVVVDGSYQLLMKAR